jgi:hypothetical protein
VNSSSLASLEQALAALNAEAALIDNARKAIAELIASAKEPARQQKVTSLVHRHVTWHAPRGSPFVADPNSKASQRLNAAAQFMVESGRDEATFIEVYQHLPHELNGSTRAREDFRSALQQSGKRVGLAYEKRPDGPIIKRLKPSA